MRGGDSSWSNWAGNQRCEPARIERPSTEAEVQAVVTAAANDGRRVRAVGSGHSFTAIACTDDVLVSLENLNRVREVDRLERTVTVEAGIELGRLNERLAAVGLAMTNLGDIAYQSLAGAVSTGTHGTGVRFGGMATQLRALRMVTADGSVMSASPMDNPELFHAARVGLGALGILTELTVAVEPAFNLAAVEGPEPIGEILDAWMDHVRGNDHFEFFWIPGTRRAMTKRNRRTTDEVAPLTRWEYTRDKILSENIGFGALCQVSRVRPSLVPRLSKLISTAPSTIEYTDRSDKVFTSPRWVKFVEMEYGVPIEDLPTVVTRIADEVKRANIDVLFPIEARAAAADDIPLSTSTGRESGYVAVHMFKGREFQQYFELVEAIVNEHDGRPHWGKMHFQSAQTLAPRYPQWDEFQRVRRGVDPDGRFSNDYLDRVLG